MQIFQLEIENLGEEYRVAFEIPNGAVVEGYGDSVTDALHSLADSYSDLSCMVGIGNE